MIYSSKILAALGTAFALPLVVSAHPAQAASFIYTDDGSTFANFTFTFGRDGTGNLLFRGVLTEPGIVTTQYSEIRAAAIAPYFNFNYVANPPVAFPSQRELRFTFDPAKDARLTFDNGILTGIFYTSEQQRFSFSDSRLCGTQGGCVVGEGFISLFLEGDRFRQFTSIRFTNFNIFGQIVNVGQNSGNLASGPIEIRTQQSVAVVPEPATLLGTGLVMAAGAVVKRHRDRLKK